MKLRLSLILAIAMANGSSGVSQTAPNQQTARAHYVELAAKLRSGDLDIDWQGLRVAAVIGAVGDPEDFQAVKTAYGELQEGRFKEALQSAQAVEGHDIADADAHYVAWRSLVELKRQKDAEKERALLAALMESITKSGDGQSAKTAWFAATIREEYLVMQMLLNVEVKQQRSAHIDGHYFDVVEVKEKGGSERLLWFNTDTDFQRMQIVTDRYKQEHGEPVKAPPQR